jgi:hypothetical protein
MVVNRVLRGSVTFARQSFARISLIRAAGGPRI